ncbi:hypothetical protein GR160_06775 [Flavobacterium sp. Sd200]|uniref:hypothetical protein n=1 Tax=Flavobacterium sp. Sd200 TaxID=2692211 RepID=UPI00144E7BAC|nr:hypothetical protein [Flavobacterium sp. Sd200]MXN90928.1 hypothetical protein [Flavobacterium sp. Sd200]
MEHEKRTTGGRISPEKAWNMLKSEGLDVTLEQAGEILDFLRRLANRTVAAYLNTKRIKPIDNESK